MRIKLTQEELPITGRNLERTFAIRTDEER